MHTLAIQTPDGHVRSVPLEGSRVSLGRSSAAELCFPDDAGLSRQHLALEREGDGWTVQDLGSKNGTFLNAVPLKAKTRLQHGDRIAAGHLIVTFQAAEQTPPAPPSPVTFYAEPESPHVSTIVTSLEGALAHEAGEQAGAAPGLSQVQALIKAGRELAGSRPLEELFGVILDLAIEAVGAQRGVLLTVEQGDLVVRAHRGKGFRISTAVRDRVIDGHDSVLVRDAQLDEAFRARVSIVEQKVRALMAVPLQTGDRIIGLIYVDSPFLVREYTRDDLNLLTVMANVAAIRIEHARLAEVEQQERIMKRELEQAAEIQRRLLPEAPPVVAGLDLAGYNSPCRTVGGDYFDFFSYHDGSVAAMLGDVSGKGMPASLLAMGLQARVHVLAQQPGNLGEMMTRLNRITCLRCPSNRFITLFHCALHPGNNQLVYANAGHNPPVLVRANGEFEFLQGGGPVLGVLSMACYEQYATAMYPGDLVVLYSDGVTEAMNPQGEEFGEARLAELLRACRRHSAQGVVDAINKALAEWAAGTPYADDITIVAARRV
ncbi:MAG: SpoIIE family protein phosphatase [Bryobacteraceae bacterium]